MLAQSELSGFRQSDLMDTAPANDLGELGGTVDDWDWFPLAWDDLPIGSVETL